MAQTALHTAWETPHAAPPLPDAWRGVLNALRVIALECRVDARDDLFHACALLTQSKPKAQDAFARALFRGMAEALGSRPIFFRPGETELSFDESWLLRLLIASHSGDGDSVAFLIRSRVPKIYQRHIGFLIRGISEQFCLI
ncbi:MAG: hypothetical protein AAGF56_09455 [Pseudomonadota bacterium]